MLRGMCLNRFNVDVIHLQSCCLVLLAREDLGLQPRSPRAELLLLEIQSC